MGSTIHTCIEEQVESLTFHALNHTRHSAAIIATVTHECVLLSHNDMHADATHSFLKCTIMTRSEKMSLWVELRSLCPIFGRISMWHVMSTKQNNNNANKNNNWALIVSYDRPQSMWVKLDEIQSGDVQLTLTLLKRKKYASDSEDFTDSETETGNNNNA